MKSIARRTLCVALCILQLSALFSAVIPPAMAAAPRTLVVEQAQRMALSADGNIKKKYNQIVLKKMKYAESVAAIKAKVKNLRSFRWTPLLSFKFPQKLDLVTEYELTVKPLILQAEIKTLQHELNDMTFGVIDATNKLFIEVYILQEQIAFTEQLLEAAGAELARSEAKLPLGTAKQADIDTMQKSLEATHSDLALLKRKFETAKAELSDMIKLDVTSGYVFGNPLKTADITRDQLTALVDYTLGNDLVFYMAKMDESVALLNLDSYEKLFRAQYGAKVGAIAPFLAQARQGMDLDTTAFKTQYDAMLKSFDAPWDHSITILFFTFTMEWLKGERSGTRYIEDEMYALYSSALEYIAARKDKEAAEKALRKQIAAEYEALITAKNSVDALLALLEDSRAMLSRVAELNKLGKAEYSEVKDQQTDYQALQIDAMEALATYNELLSSFDRLTCGAVSKLMSGTGLETDVGDSGESNADLPHYYIYTDIANMVFVFGVDIPEDYEPSIDSYEIWYEGTRIGEKTAADKQLRHLAIDYGDTNMLTVRLFDGDEYVDECEIDTTIPRDVLALRGAVRPTQAERIVGSYSISTSSLGNVGMSALTLTMAQGAGAQFYKMTAEGADLLTGEIKSVADPFHYLTLMVPSIESIRIIFYDANKEEIYTARLCTDDQSLRVVV